MNQEPKKLYTAFFRFPDGRIKHSGITEYDEHRAYTTAEKSPGDIPYTEGFIEVLICSHDEGDDSGNYEVIRSYLRDADKAREE